MALLAILHSGGAYVPVDPHYPPLRQEMIIRDSRAQVLVTSEACMEEADVSGLGGGQLRVVVVLDGAGRVVRTVGTGGGSIRTSGFFLFAQTEGLSDSVHDMR